MRWFGEPWPLPEERAPVCELDEHRVETPVGEGCLYCDSNIEADDRGVVMPYLGPLGASIHPVHLGCLLRVIGAVGEDGWPRR